MFKLFFAFTILFLVSVTSTAQVGTFLVGNGGQVVVCRDGNNEITSVELFDFYEGRKITKQGRVTPLRANRLKDAINILKSRFTEQGYGKNINHIITKYAESFSKEAVFIKDTELKLTNDISSQFKPKNCNIEQIVTQQRPTFIYKPRYLVNYELWQKLDVTNKAGLILHEILYRVKIDKFTKDTPDSFKLNAINIRQIVYFIASDTVGRFVNPPRFRTLLNRELGKTCKKTSPCLD